VIDLGMHGLFHAYSAKPLDAKHKKMLASRLGSEAKALEWLGKVHTVAEYKAERKGAKRLLLDRMIEEQDIPAWLTTVTKAYKASGAKTRRMTVVFGAQAKGASGSMTFGEKGKPHSKGDRLHVINVRRDPSSKAKSLAKSGFPKAPGAPWSLTHELGHVIWYQLPATQRKLSKEWFAKVVAGMSAEASGLIPVEKKTLLKKAKKGVGGKAATLAVAAGISPSEYGLSSPSEMFAEIFGYLTTKPHRISRTLKRAFMQIVNGENPLTDKLGAKLAKAKQKPAGGVSIPDPDDTRAKPKKGTWVESIHEVLIGQVSKSKANYVCPSNRSKKSCGNCGANLGEGRCARVKGKISNGCVCDLWRRTWPVTTVRTTPPPPAKPPANGNGNGNGETPPANGGDGGTPPPAGEAVYGTKPAKPTHAWQVQDYLRKRANDSKVEFRDFGPGQEYRFLGGEADKWPEDSQYTGYTQLKQRSFEQWWKLYAARRKKHGTKGDGKFDPKKHTKWSGAKVYEGEPGDGEEPADKGKARTLANAFKKDKNQLALMYRQLWRHKYSKGNYDRSKAWKLFYWPLTHSGAGGKGFGPATRKVAAKMLVGDFEKWAKADMKATVQRAGGAEEKPVGDISRAEFIKWFA
jgi:hypothetical protein